MEGRPETKRRKLGDDNTVLRINSAYFQTLMLQRKFSEALNFSSECDMHIDNSKLYSCVTTETGMIPTPIFLIWTQIEICANFSENNIRALFHVLVATGARKGVSGNIYYKTLRIKSFATIPNVIWHCLMSRPDLFSRNYALKCFASVKSLESENYEYFLKSLDAAFESVDPYKTLNFMSLVDLNDFFNPLHAAVRIGCSRRLMNLLYLIPIVDLDVFLFESHILSEHWKTKLQKYFGWHSIEEWASEIEVKDVVINTIIREARAILEDYRAQRAQIVLQDLSLPIELLNIINEYGERPPVKTTANTQNK